jgi:pre-mRNA-splicing factor ATP-dependent RNA helicase DHX15/PRP43
LYTDYDNIKKFFNLLETKQVILLVSGTGSGKTVFIPKFFLKYLITLNIPGKIAITNPKQITTLNNAKYGAATLDVELGNEVGYAYKNSESTSKSDITRLLYVTDGYILSILKSKDRLLSEYIGIIVDEAHERNIQIDFLLKYLKDIVLARPEFKVIIMSATINSEVFRKYYNIDNIKYGEINIIGAVSYSIERIWENEEYKDFTEKDNYLKIALNKCIEIYKKDKKDMIVFLPKTNDTNIGCTILNKKNMNAFCVELHAKITKEEKILATSKNISNKIKIILATNVAESSLTVDGLYYVIDTGLELVSQFDSKYGMQVLKITNTTQSQIIQRIGRVGRTMPGIAYHLYTQDQFNNFDLYPKPNIITSDLTEIILDLFKFYNSKEIQFFLNDLITIPNNDQITYSIYKLQFYNCISFAGNDNSIATITSIGKSILKIRDMDLISIYAIFLAKFLNCQEEIIIIMAIISQVEKSLDKLFVYKELKKFRKYIHKYSYTNSDHITILNIYVYLYLNQKYEYLKISIFKKIEKKILEIKKVLSSLNNSHYENFEKYNLIEVKPFNNIDYNILYILYKAYQLNLIKDNKTINFINNVEGKIDFNAVTKINTDSESKNNLFIAHNIINKFGKKLFNTCSEIPHKLIDNS